MTTPLDDPFEAFQVRPFKPLTRWERFCGWVSWRVRSWWCERVGHDVRSGSGFNGEYTEHWWECRRCGDGGSD